MPQLNPIVLKDNAAADHTFNPRDITGGVATLVSSTGVPIGDQTVSVASTRTTTGRRKVSIKLVVPVVQDSVVNGISRPAVVRTAYADVVFTFDGGSTLSERQNALAYLKNFLSEASLGVPVITTLAAPY